MKNLNTPTMQAIVATGYGDPSVLQYETVAKPAPAPGEILVKVYAAPVTRADTMVRTGKPYFGRLFLGLLRPSRPIPGTGFAGVVAAVGSEVEGFQPGDRVCGETTFAFSTNAEFVTVPAKGVVLPMPDNLDYAAAATLCDGPVTSLNFLKEIGKIQAGQRVLINGASGSLGTAAVQLAKYFGAEVTGVCSHRNTGLVRSLGADYVIDYTHEDFTRGDKQYDLVYDTVGTLAFSRVRRVLAADGKYLSPVLGFSLLLQMLWTSLVGGRRAMFAATGTLPDDKLRDLLGQVLDIIRQGRLKIIMDRQYPLAKAAEAHTYIDAGRKKGNVTLIIHPE